MNLNADCNYNLIIFFFDFYTRLSKAQLIILSLTIECIKNNRPPTLRKKGCSPLV